MKDFLKWLQSKMRFKYPSLITIEISRSNILHNLSTFNKLAPRRTIAPVLKSNAYGHGLYEVAKILESNKDEFLIPFFCIDSHFEAMSLRARGFKTPLLVLGYTYPELMMKTHLKNISFAITSLDALQHLESTEKPVNIHLKIDTGMHRHGILKDEVEKAIELLVENPMINLEGIFTHFADADGEDPSFTEGQILVWNNVVKRFRREFNLLKYVHASATYGHKFTNEIDANVSRLGIGLYGLVEESQFEKKLDLKPALVMKSVITSIKKINRDDTVGYNNTFKADKDMTIATIPVGYYEGLDRRLSNKGYVIENCDNICPIVGRISMNISTIDISSVPGIKSGEEIVVISNNSNMDNSIMGMAKLAKTIPYDIVIRIPAHLKRVVVE